MAVDHDQHTRSSDDASTIALLRCLRAGATVDFVHCIDVLSAAPSDLVASLEPAPGIDGVWYFYCLKQYKNAQGKACGHRKRAISGGDTCWHAEGRPKEVDGSEPGTACNLSYGYGRKDGRSFSRLGWCMTEYDDDQDQTGYVLCKVYRSPRAQVKVKPPSSSAGSKRKATGVEHPEAPPAKLPHEEYAVAPSTVAQANGEEWIGGCQPEMFRSEDMQHVQKLSTEEPTQDGGEFFETPYGPLPSEVAQVDVMEWIGGMEEMSGGEEGHGLLEQQTQTGEQDNGFLAYPTAEGLFGYQETTASGMPPPAVDPLPDCDFFDGMEPFLGVREEQSVQMQQPRAEPADPLAEFVQSQWIAFQQQESPWMTMRRLLQGPPSFLKCS